MRVLYASLCFLAACSGGGGTTTDGGSGGDSSISTMCNITWSGAASGSAPCKGNTKLLGVMTAMSLNWLVNGENDAHTVSFTFNLPVPPSAMMYAGTTMNEQFCTARVQTKTGALSVWNASSKPLASTMMPLGSCSITFTSVVDESSGSTRTYVVHGTATATMVKEADMSMMTMTITF